jgi:hypothetical protein
LDASGKASGQTGGAIDVNAQKIQVKATAKLDVSGDAGGGKIAIGGGGPNTRTQSFTPAASTTIASGAHLDASALTRGDGGEIVVFTSLTNPLAFTQVAGSLIARGGTQSGNGGFVETSGYRLDVEGIIVNASAPQGRRGLWLLDPDNIYIIMGPSSLPAGCAIRDCSTVTASSLDTILSAGTDVTLTATNSIYVNYSVTWGGVTGYGSLASSMYYPTLTLNAGNAIDFYPGSTIKGRGRLIMTAGGNVSVGDILIDYWSTFGTGVVTITAGGSLVASSAIKSGTVSLSAGGGMAIQGDVYAAGTLTLDANTTAGSSAELSISTALAPVRLVADARLGSLTVASGVGSISGYGAVSLSAQTVNINGPVSSYFASGEGTVSILNATTVNINSSIRSGTGRGTISVAAPSGAINVAADLFSSNTTLSAADVNFSQTAASTGGSLNVTASNSITLDKDYSASATVFDAPVVNWNAVWSSGNAELRANTVNWGAGGGYSGLNGPVLTLGVPARASTTTFNLVGDLSLQAWRIDVNNPLAWSTYQLSLNGNQTFDTPFQGVALNASLTGTSGAKLVIANSFASSASSNTISLTGTPANQSTFTFGGGAPQTTGSVDYTVGVNKHKVVIDNSGVSGGGSGSGSSEAAVVVTPVVTTTSTTTATAAAEAAAKVAADAAAAQAATDAAAAKASTDAVAAKAAADAAAAKAAADAVTAKAATLDTVTRVFVEQAITQAVATVVASTGAAVFVAPAPVPPVPTTMSSANTTTSSGTTANSSSASTTSTATTATTANTATATSTTAATTTASAGASSTAQSTNITQEFVEPLSVTTLSSTTSTLSDPGDKSVATTSTTSGPTSQTTTPASTTTAAPAAPSLTPVAVSKDGADAGDFTLQTVKPPALVTAPKQQARTTERVTNTPVSPGISLQSTQKTPPPSGSVLGREISGVGNSSAW